MRVARAANIHRLQQEYDARIAMSQSLWMRAPEYIWSRSFWYAPLAMPIVVLLLLFMRRPGGIDRRCLLITYFVAAPVGFLLWVVTWKTNGAGTGHISATVGTTSLCGWIAMNRGLWLTWIDRRYFSGTSLLTITILLMLGVKVGMERGTTPISLTIVTALNASSILLMGLVGKYGSVLFGFLGRKFVPPVWRFLLQPISLCGGMIAKPSDLAELLP